eukprot:tig00000056_g24050.t2
MQRAARCRRRLREREAAPPRDSDAEEYEALQELSLRLLEEYDIAAAAAAAAAAPEPPAEPPPGPPPEPEPLSAPPPARASSCSLPAARAAVPCTVTTPERSRSARRPARFRPRRPGAAAGAKRPVGPAGRRRRRRSGLVRSRTCGRESKPRSSVWSCRHAPRPTRAPARRPRHRPPVRPSAGRTLLSDLPEQAVLCGSEHVSTSNVIVADRSGERLRLTFWRAGAAWAQRLWPGDVLQVFSVALKEWQGQVTGNVGRASDARVLRRLRTGPERAPEPYGRPLHPPPDPEVVDGLATWAAEHHAPLLRPAAGPRAPPAAPRPVDFAPSLAALQPDTLLHVRVRVLAAPRLPQAPPPASGQSGRRRRLRVTVVVADTPDRPVCLHLWEEGVARLLPLLCPGTLVELQYLQCRADPHLPAGRPHLHCTPRTAAAPLSPADPAAARLVAAFGPLPSSSTPPLPRCPRPASSAYPPWFPFSACLTTYPGPATASAWTMRGTGGVPGRDLRLRGVPPPLSAEEAVRWEFRPPSRC